MSDILKTPLTRDDFVRAAEKIRNYTSGCSTRAYNLCRLYGCETYGDLLERKESEFKTLYRCGPLTNSVIKELVKMIEEKVAVEKPSMRTICWQAVKKFGEQSQIDMCIEECAELIVALQHWKRGRESNVVTEIADVQIMCGQMAELFGVDEVKAECDRKLERLYKRIQQYKR